MITSEWYSKRHSRYKADNRIAKIRFNYKNSNGKFYDIAVNVKYNELKTEQIAQIQNIVSRELKGDIENIHISCKE